MSKRVNSLPIDGWFKDLPQEYKDDNKEYRHLAENGTLVEHWVKMDGRWINVTAVTKAYEELRKAEEAYNAINNISD